MRQPISQFVLPPARSSIQRKALEGHYSSSMADGCGDATGPEGWRYGTLFGQRLAPGPAFSERHSSRFPPFTVPILKGNSGRSDPFARPRNCLLFARMRRLESVESECGAVALGQACLF